MPTAHPRSRGENAWKLKGKAIVSGSSPLTRGKRDSVAKRGSIRGLIPAHAGKTGGIRAGAPTVGAHPRSRGENRLALVVGDDERGSSPLTRGKLCYSVISTFDGGLIPAHAGKTTIGCLRRCGPGGSSPLTRGKREGQGVLRVVQRLIPAHAGKTRSRLCLTPSSRAHPRSRGENSPSRPWTTPGRGSSPLTRGKPGAGRARRSPVRLIPAHAGKTPRPSVTAVRKRAHPRSRGENTPIRFDRDCKNGSSPLTRGKPLMVVTMSASAGLIPAHAGKTSPGRRSRRDYRAHPRSRGENAGLPVTCSRWRGSSPLTRGKP